MKTISFAPSVEKKNKRFSVKEKPIWINALLHSSSCSRDSDNIGWVSEAKEELKEEQKQQFIESTIQPSINNAKWIQYECCEKCCEGGSRLQLPGEWFANSLDEEERSFEEHPEAVLNASLSKAIVSAVATSKAIGKCIKCEKAIWIPPWYFKGVVKHQEAVDWYMINIAKKRKTIKEGGEVCWCTVLIVKKKSRSYSH